MLNFFKLLHLQQGSGLSSHMSKITSVDKQSAVGLTLALLCCHFSTVQQLSKVKCCCEEVVNLKKSMSEIEELTRSNRKNRQNELNSVRW